MLIARDVDGNTTANINGRSFDVQIDRQARSRAAALCAIARLCIIGRPLLRTAARRQQRRLCSCKRPAACCIHAVSVSFMHTMASQADLFGMFGCSFVCRAVVCRVGDSLLLAASDQSPCFQLAFVQLREALSTRRSSCTAWGRPCPTGRATTRLTSRCASLARAARRPSRSAAFKGAAAAAPHTCTPDAALHRPGDAKGSKDHWQEMQRRRCCTWNLMLVPLARAARWRLPVR